MSNHEPFDHKAFLKSVTPRPGIYQMLDARGEVLYVGKARNLKKRVASYFRASGLAAKTLALVQRIARIEVTVTRTETEALLLEQNLIKQSRPPYNILLRDDKSYPYIYVSTDQAFPRVTLHRGARRGKGRYFGPYPSAGAVRESLNFLQKVFRVRQCEDSVFRNRTRPCLQYQIKRCTGPCVDLVSPEDYAEDVRHTLMFLEGRSTALSDELADRMEHAATSLDFEAAAVYRDQIRHLQALQSSQYIEGESGDIDLVACCISQGQACVQLIYVRGGRVLGSRAHFPRSHLDEQEGEVLEAFIAQYYLAGNGRALPAEILVSHPLPDAALLEAALAEARGAKVRVSHSCRASRARWLDLARTTAAQNLGGRLAGRASQTARLQALQAALELPEPPARMECFDISHSSGEATVASCVVFDENGPRKADYRKFNIEDIQPGDDYAAMAQALSRRYARLKKDEAQLPDILFIDGGKGQVAQAKAVLDELAIQGVQIIGVAKGPDRKAGYEVLHWAGNGRERRLPADSPALHLIQHIRDEAHRFAVTGHKQRRDRKRRESGLEALPGIGPKRRRELLRHFGGAQEVARASVEDLCRVPGISERIAKEIYETFHGG